MLGEVLKQITSAFSRSGTRILNDQFITELEVETNLTQFAREGVLTADQIKAALADSSVMDQLLETANNFHSKVYAKPVTRERLTTALQRLAKNLEQKG